MVSDSRSDAVAVAVNGELYNYRSLREELGPERFLSESDSEVVLHGYEKWGIRGLLDRLEGMFAFSIVDVRQRKLYLVRDHIGIKPLYYGREGRLFFWCSELKAAIKFFEPHRLATDKSSLYDFLTYRYIPGPKTVFESCRKLEPAHFCEIDLPSGSLSLHRYWAVEAVDADHSLESAAQELRSLIGNSVQAHLISDVPVGFFLSGGIDSSVVVAEAAARHKDLSTFSIGYDEPAHDETMFAEIVARRFGTKHMKEILGADSTEDLLPQMLSWYDEPFADTSALPTYHVSRLARRHVAVVLTGDGGDELFGGYSWYRRFERFRRLQAPVPGWFGKGPRWNLASGRKGLIRKVASRLDLLSRFDELEMYATLLGGYIPSEKEHYRRMFEIEDDYDDMWHFRRFYRPDLPLLKRMQYLDFHTYLPDDILTKVDRVSMAVSLEARVPLLTPAIARFAFGLPEKLLYYGSELKGLLKYAYRDVLPVEILHRRKKGFSIPINRWDPSINNDVRVIQQRLVISYVGSAGVDLVPAADS